jgi:hypothetical protein
VRWIYDPVLAVEGWFDPVILIAGWFDDEASGEFVEPPEPPIIPPVVLPPEPTIWYDVWVWTGRDVRPGGNADPHWPKKRRPFEIELLLLG